MNNIKSLHLGIIFLVIVAFFALPVLRAGLTGEISRLGGPNAIAAQGGQVFAVYRDRLLALSSRGELLSETSLSPLGEDVVISDLQITDDGLLLGDLYAGRIYRCYLGPFRCELLFSAASPLRAPFKFYLTEDGDLWVSEGPKDRLLRLSAGGMQPLPVELSGKGLNAPNRVLLADDRLVIADTNHHRIVAYEMASDEPLREVFSFAAGDHPRARSSRIWPTDVAFSGGKWWTLNGDGLLEDADLLAFSADGTPLMRIDFPAEADPISLVASGGDLLLTDYTAYAVYQVDAASGEWRHFGDDAFQQLMQQGKVEVEALEARAQLYLYAMIALMVLGFVLALWFERGRIRAQGWSSLFTKLEEADKKVKGQVMSDATQPGVQWFVPDQKRMRRLRRLGSFSLGMTLLLPFPLIFVFMSLDAGEQGEKLMPEMWPFILLWAGLLGMTALALRIFRNRLGFEGTDLLFRDHRMRVRRVPAAEVVYTKRAILHRDLIVPLRDGHGKAFYSPRLQDLLFQGLLLPAKKLNEWQLFVYQLKHRSPLIMMIVAMFVVLIVAQVLRWAE